MASTMEERLFEEFQGLSQGVQGVGTPGMAAGEIALLARGTAPETAAKAAAPAGGSGTGATGTTARSVLETVFRSGLGMAPLVSGLLSLFGGGSAPAAPALTKFAMPEQIGFEGVETAGGIAAGDYDQMGMARAYQANAASSPAQATQPAQITVNVQAMDARSFLDRSGEIAQAVREAMLNSNAINDVVNEL